MKNPLNALEEQLMTIEDLETADKLKSHRFSMGESDCDICNTQIAGRHLIDGLLRNTNNMWATMCPQCYSVKGSGFGEGKGQLYSKTDEGKWLMTSGFTAYHLSEIEEYL